MAYHIFVICNFYWMYECLSFILCTLIMLLITFLFSYAVDHCFHVHCGRHEFLYMFQLLEHLNLSGNILGNTPAENFSFLVSGLQSLMSLKLSACGLTGVFFRKNMAALSSSFQGNILSQFLLLNCMFCALNFSDICVRFKSICVWIYVCV